MIQAFLLHLSAPEESSVPPCFTDSTIVIEMKKYIWHHPYDDHSIHKLLKTFNLTHPKCATSIVAAQSAEGFEHLNKKVDDHRRDTQNFKTETRNSFIETNTSVNTLRTECLQTNTNNHFKLNAWKEQTIREIP